MKGPHVSYTIEIDTFDTLTVSVTSDVLDVVAKVVVGVIIISISLFILSIIRHLYSQLQVTAMKD